MAVNKILTFLFLIPLLTSCDRGYRIEGNSSVNILDGKLLYLKVMRNGQMVKIDSAEVVHGLFSMKGKVDSVEMATLYMDEESILPIVLEDGKIKISVSNMSVDVSGTRLNDALYEFIHKRNDMEVSIREVSRRKAKAVLDGLDYEAVKVGLDAEKDSLEDEMKRYVKTFISDNYENALGPSVFIMLCSSLPYPIMTPEIDDIVKDAPYSFKNNILVKEFLSRAKENERLIEESRRLNAAESQN